jgi:transposase
MNKARCPTPIYRNARLPPETQDYLRQQAIQLRAHGKRVNDISEYLGVHRNTISEWEWEYQHYGEAAVTQHR